MTAAFDVAIVGFGPAGATCANLLGARGIRTLVVDKESAVYDRPRAFALDHEVMRAFQNLGLADTIAPFTRPFTVSEYYGTQGQLIKRLGSVPPPYPLGWPPNMVFTQPPVEAALRRHAATHPSVTISLGDELIALAQTPDEVALTLAGADGATRSVTSRYVIGCDGASSTVRTLVGLRYVDLEFDEPWLVVDLRVSEAGLAKLPDVSVQYCEPSRPATYLIGPANHRRWEIMVMPGEDRRAMESEDNVWRLLARWITPDDAVLWRRASYRFHALVADEWRRERIFIAGDAAHQQPPFTGQGMCQGVRDVVNLAWKLDAVLGGRAGDALLDTYTVERRAHVERLTTIIKDIGRLICERDPDAAGARDRRLIAEAGGQVQTQPRQALIPPLTQGLLSPDAHRANGTLFPQPRVHDGAGTALLDDVTGTGLRVIASEACELAELAGDPTLARLDCRLVQIASADRPRGQAHAEPLPGVAVVESEGVVGRWFEQNQCVAAIVRPDHYVYGVATSAAGIAQQLRAWQRALANAGPGGGAGGKDDQPSRRDAMSLALTIDRKSGGTVVKPLQVLALLLCMTVSPAFAQTWPDKPVRIVLSQPPGSGPDNVARILSDNLARQIGKSIVVDNKPGGQNMIGAQAAARSPADGYTFYLATTAALVTNAYLFKSLSYDPQKDFAPVGFIGKSPFAILVESSSPIKSIQDLIARAKAEPGKLSVANEGPKTFGGMIARLLNARAGLDTTLIPYVNVGAAVKDTLGGRVDVLVADVASTAQFVKQGQLRMLAVTSLKRIDGWEQVPAVSELVPGFDMVGWLAVVAPAGTPPAIIQRMNRHLDTALLDKEVADKIHSVGPMSEGAGTPDQLGAFLAAEHQRWALISREIGVLPE